ncbi:hypothetical protein BU26DRAFT_260886 [Trematosphaeria pertusa]|uniref:Berberine/berberine-like domain-containing protein n=1 Tax=Trematosphaeria pertusa TaxID=390896 RepID=A0A6A6IS59_9PLEO|nr:uncharacterized protein BU26DRAFT_260886 [Trematosphaeria pertusa]KAF2252652.1 hypothetical protein BU26DRAFT_260886 [Trematosphaeria pertusa]
MSAEGTVTYELGHPRKDASPDSASYVNEGDVNEPDWQERHWGSHYPKRLEIKKKCDLEGVFYAKATPGTENWELDGKLCKKRREYVLSAGGTLDGPVTKLTHLIFTS